MKKVQKTYSLPVLLYHRIVNKQSLIGKHKVYVQQKDFEKQMLYLKNNGYQTITFFDLQQQPSMDLFKKVIITFDDGYKDNYELMFPVLKKYGFKAVIYLVTKINYNSWGVVEGEPRIDMMIPEQIKEMSDNGIEMGAHTQLHKDLLKCTQEERIQEIKGSKEDVERLTNKKVVSFAYPFGGINNDIKKVTQDAGYSYAVSTNTGPKEFGKDLFQIRRIEITPKTTLNSFKNKVSGNYFYPSFFRSFFTGKQTN
jgi:peptidoglycan/xylan/chitin deacetylase (PgdA/CDA1 family)